MARSDARSIGHHRWWLLQPAAVSAALLAAAGLLLAAGCGLLDRSDGLDGARAAGSDAAAIARGVVDGERHVPVIEWDDCDERFLRPLLEEEMRPLMRAGERCGTIEVPVDWSDPAGAQVELALARLPARGETTGRPLFINPGGPGGSGVETLVLVDWPDALRDHFDIIGFDPRGTGRSEAIECGGFHMVTIAPLTSYFEEWEEVVEVCDDEHGDLLAHVGTRDVVRDLDAMRAALEVGQLSYLGWSYGTVIGAHYAERYPDHVRAMVLDGPVDNSVGLREQVVLDAASGDAALDAFFSWCLAHEDECLLAALGDPAELYDRAAGFLAVDPAGGRGALGVDDGGFAMLTYLLLMGGEEAYETLDLAVVSALGGHDNRLLDIFDFFHDPDALQEIHDRFHPETYRGIAFRTFLEERTEEHLEQWGRLGPWPPLREDGEAGSDPAEPPPLESHYTVLDLTMVAVLCADSRVEIDRDDIAALIGAAWEAGPRIGWYNSRVLAECARWPVPAGDLGPVAAEGAPPILVVTSEVDPATPLEGARAVAEQLDDARLVTYGGAGHGIAFMDLSRCVDRIATDYLVDLAVPQEDLRCERED